jgi:NodT family efflux transporter outer membrane factor (OMF) lipoprotein
MARRGAALLTAATVLAACTVGPDYVRPDARVPPAYRELDGWKVAEPSDAVLRGAWWEVFGDATLNDLERQVDVSSQTVALAEAQLRQARALVQEARSRYFPTITVGLGFTRARESATTSNGGGGTGRTFSTFQLPIEFAWELDLWGRIRRTVESTRAGAEASVADLETARLSVRAEVAQDYVQLRALDAEKALLDATATAYTKSLELTRNRYASGVVSKGDVLQAESQLKTTEAQAIDLGVQRAQFEHAIALLVGRPASELSLPPSPLDGVPPAVPVSLPSQLLERRPDVAAAERRVAAANAQIGVAQAAYYPTVTLGASSGFESSSLANWLTWPSRFWSIGPGISETVFDGGFRGARKDEVRALYDQSVATYRQTVLTAFQEVEDNLAALRLLEAEARVQDDAVSAARQALAVTTNQYRAGTVSYLSVVVSQAIALANEKTAVDILSRRMTASVLLIKALGGGWSATDMGRDAASPAGTVAQRPTRPAP